MLPRRLLPYPVINNPSPQRRSPFNGLSLLACLSLLLALGSAQLYHLHSKTNAPKSFLASVELASTAPQIERQDTPPAPLTTAFQCLWTVVTSSGYPLAFTRFVPTRTYTFAAVRAPPERFSA
ncbi:hypothetical protein M5M_14485 [Simiduia agarivorans SA1 = DSM 21679]|uniref:Uncharacterized protein n=1 Tax=Simiduia agarivorans (strain DSM 21679 / JCM 13881 / BCRC 17597 / SA1) TaxID=1117647 RepID=K4KPI6_SIMAS|nr:hypothetical protein M5M_14485 [Simiduia agarivorans SA1 = DSM 21679]